MSGLELSLELLAAQGDRLLLLTPCGTRKGAGDIFWVWTPSQVGVSLQGQGLY